MDWGIIREPSWECHKGRDYFAIILPKPFKNFPYPGSCHWTDRTVLGFSTVLHFFCTPPCLWIKARGLGQGCTRPAGRAPGRPSPGAAGVADRDRPPVRAGMRSRLVFSKGFIGNSSLCVASPEQANSHSSDASYHGEQGYNTGQCPMQINANQYQSEFWNQSEYKDQCRYCTVRKYPQGWICDFSTLARCFLGMVINVNCWSLCTLLCLHYTLPPCFEKLLWHWHWNILWSRVTCLVTTKDKVINGQKLSQFWSYYPVVSMLLQHYLEYWIKFKAKKV